MSDNRGFENKTQIGSSREFRAEEETFKSGKWSDEWPLLFIMFRLNAQETRSDNVAVNYG